MSNEIKKIPTMEYLSMSYEKKIEIMIETPERLDLPEEVSYLAQYLAQYRPIIPPDAHLDNESSLDIRETMESVCDFEIRLISRVMKMLGYKLDIIGLPKWAMKHIDSK